MHRQFDTTIFRLRQYAWTAMASVRTLWWKTLGMKIGCGTRLPRVHVTWPHQVSLGAMCTIEHDVVFRFDGPWAPGPAMVFGNEVFIGTGCEFNIQRGLTVGNRCLIASGCRFIDHDHSVKRPDLGVPVGPEDARLEAITLEDGAWIGTECVILRGVNIGRGAIVAAGAVVTKSVNAFEIWAGVPAQKIGIRPE